MPHTPHRLAPLATLLLALALTSLTTAAGAAEWHVAGSGSDANNGKSAATAFRTLQKAEAVVAPGDVVLIGDGIYSKEEGAKEDGSALLKISKSGRPDAWITWKARPGSKPELRPRQWAGIEITGSYHIIDGLTVMGASDELALSKAMAATRLTVKDPLYNTNGIIVEGRRAKPDAKPHHVIIRNNTVAKVPGGGIVVLEGDHITIEDNLVYDNAWYMEYAGSGITFLNNWQVDDAPGYHVVIQRNKVFNNKTLVPWSRTGKHSDGNGILLDVTDQEVSAGATNPNGDAVVEKKAEAAPAKPKRPLWTARSLIANNLSAFNGGSGIHTFRTSHVDIVNNTTYWNGTVVDYEELFANRSTDIVILNNVIVPRPGGKVTSNNRNTSVKWDYNLYPVDQQVMKGANDIVADPRFLAPLRDIARADFRLAKDSPAIGSGSADIAQALDLAGIKRPVTARDRGAYEQ